MSTEPKPHPALTGPTWDVYEGDAASILAGLPDASVHAVITDPPYGLTDLPRGKVAEALRRWASGESDWVPGEGKGFQGQRWDRFVPPPALWEQVLRVMTPGAHLACFAGARTLDLMGVSLRLAGFELRDTIAWVNGARMPKTTDLSKVMSKAGIDPEQAQAWRGWTSALKPAIEPIILARKPLEGTVASTVLAYGSGALHVDACRVAFAGQWDEEESKGKNQHTQFGTTHGNNNVYGVYAMPGFKADYDAPGRLPSNLILDDEAARALDAVNPPSRSRKGRPRASVHAGDGWGATATGAEYDDAGGPSRFFTRLTAADDELTHAERELDRMPTPLLYAARASSAERPVVNKVRHHTVKPLVLMRHLVCLLTPPGGKVLDPFAGSGTTVEACLLEGARVVACEKHGPYLPLVAARIERATAEIAARP